MNILFVNIAAKWQSVNILKGKKGKYIMKKKFENIYLIGMIISGIIASSFLIYGGYWFAKTVSYNIFYKDMVRSTIIKMVDSESLKIK